MRFRDQPRIPLPPPVRCLTIGKGTNERPLVYTSDTSRTTSDTSRTTRRSHGRYNHSRDRIPGVAIPYDQQPWRTA